MGSNTKRITGGKYEVMRGTATETTAIQNMLGDVARLVCLFLTSYASRAVEYGVDTFPSNPDSDFDSGPK